MKKRTESWMEISHICLLRYSWESEERDVHSSTLQFGDLSGEQKGSVKEKKFPQKSLHQSREKLRIHYFITRWA